MTNNKIQVYSEIGKLESVIIHKPGAELQNLTPSLMEQLLFDELPYLKSAREEHDDFAEIFRENGVKVNYLEDLVAESIQKDEVKEAFIYEFLQEADIKTDYEKQAARELLNSIRDEKKLVLKMMEGIRKQEVEINPHHPLYNRLDQGEFFIAKPMPNLYFTRDPFALVGNNLSLNHMWSQTRKRETLFGKYIFRYHPELRLEKDYIYDRSFDYSIEGGDICILSDEVIAVGISQRTESLAVEQFAKRLLSGENSYKKIIAFHIPNMRTMMHLDTVFTMVDRDLFTVHPGMEDFLNLYILELVDGEIKITEEHKDLEYVLKKMLHVDKIEMIKSGTGGLLDAAREQWSDGYNTLAIAPREVIVYERNTVTNRLLEEKGAKLHVMRSGELSRGRGGPRCMSMPLRRALLENK